jgi:outer membrane protein insertion porin family
LPIRRDKIIFVANMHGHRFVLTLACLSCALLAACHLAAQGAQPSFVVSEVHAFGSHRYNDAQIAATAGLKPGDAVDNDKLQAIASELAQLGVFSRVNYRFTAKNRRAVINFELEDAQLVPVMFENFPWFSDQELYDEIRRAVPLFDGYAPNGGTLLDEITAALSVKLASRGIKANVEHTLVAEPSGSEMITQFRQDGPSFTVSSVQFNDFTAQNSEKLHDRMSDLVGKTYSRFSIELFENEQVRPLYLAAGEIRVKFDAPIVQLSGTSGANNPATVIVQIPIKPGAVFHISGVTWTGNTALDNPALSRLVAVRPGDLADGMRLAAGWQQIELEYGHRGYLDAKVTPLPEFQDANGTVAYNVKIEEGAQYRMGELVITGLSLDSERALRNNWRLAPGQVFDKTYLDSMLAKLEKPTVAIFGDIPLHYAQMGHWLRPNPQNHVIDVLIDFQ